MNLFPKEMRASPFSRCTSLSSSSYVGFAHNEWIVSVCPGIASFSGGFSAAFQGLEFFRPFFPDLGKNGSKSSNVWKNGQPARSCTCQSASLSLTSWIGLVR